LYVFYFFQDLPSQYESNEYAIVISDIKNIGYRLSKLNKFLEQEQKRVADTEATIKKLKDEKTELEPIVFSQRQTVEAVLSAYAKKLLQKFGKKELSSSF
jgi:polysaccharide pyruvyl transferase WcaK-like protein